MLSPKGNAEKTGATVEEVKEELQNMGVSINGRSENLNGSTERNAVLGADQQSGEAAGGMEQTGSAEAADQGAAADERRNRAVGIRETATRDLIKAGTERESVKVIPSEMYDDEIRAADKRIRELGYEPVFVIGEIEGYDHGKIVSGRGVIEGNRIIIQADNSKLTVEQIAEHEIGHAEETAELNEESEKLIRERFSEEEFAAVVDAYIRNLEGYSKEEIISEIVQDARAGINNFGKETAKYKETVREVYDRARNNAVSQEANGERETRGPGAWSRGDETSKYDIERKFTGDPYHDAKVVYAEAKSVQKELNDTIRKVSETIGTKTKYQDSTQKSISSMVKKVTRKGGAEKYPLLKMKDHTRTKIEIDSFEQIPEVLNALDAKNIPYQTENVRNEWGYNGFHVTWRNNNGITSELQITTPEVWELKLWSDEIYDKWRNFELESATDEEIDEFNAAKLMSQERWGKEGIPDLAIYERASSSERTRPSVVSQTNNELFKGPQLPSKNSNGRPLQSSKMSLPDSVRINMVTPPSDTIIDEKSININRNNTEVDGSYGGKISWSRGGENLLSEEETVTGQLTEEESAMLGNSLGELESKNRSTLEVNGYRYDMVIGQKGEKVRAILQAFENRDGRRVAVSGEQKIFDSREEAISWLENKATERIIESKGNRMTFASILDNRTTTKQEAQKLAEENNNPMLHDEKGEAHRIVPEWTWVQFDDGRYGSEKRTHLRKQMGFTLFSAAGRWV